MNHRTRSEKGKKGAYIGIIGNLILFAVKLPLGILGNSYALIAASFHTLSDALSSFVVLAGFHAITKPADEKHQYGHGDAEAITGLVVAILIVLIGIEVGKASFFRLLSPSLKIPGLPAAIGAVISISGNWFMARKARDIGLEIRSPSLVADSAHHASDAISSVVVLVGIFLSMLGYPRLDSLAGFLVALFIIKTGFNVGHENIDMLMGMVPDTGLIAEIERRTMKVNGVEGVHSVKVHYVGALAYAQMHIEVDQNMAVIDADRVAHQVQAKIVSELEDVSSAIIHVCPRKGEANA